MQPGARGELCELRALQRLRRVGAELRARVGVLVSEADPASAGSSGSPGVGLEATRAVPQVGAPAPAWHWRRIPRMPLPGPTPTSSDPRHLPGWFWRRASAGGPGSGCGMLPGDPGATPRRPFLPWERKREGRASPGAEHPEGVLGVQLGDRCRVMGSLAEGQQEQPPF